MLIGLGAKNAVLRVSAAVEFRKQGKSIMEATILAGEQRLRPIIMTSLAFAIGCLPLALAVGAGANARHSIGTGIIGGMLGETTLAMLYVPLLFYLFDRLKEGEAKGSADGGAPSAPHRRPPPARRRASAAPPAAMATTDDAPRVVRRRASPRALLAGCMMGPDYARPAVDAPKRVHLRAEGRRRHREHASGGSSSTTRCSTRSSPRRSRNNLNVKVAVANVEQAAGVLTQTRSALFPQVGYDGRAGRARTTEAERHARNSRGSSPIRRPSYQALLTASWEIDLWGRIRRLSESARANLLATDEARRGVILSLVASVAEQLPARCAGSTSSSSIAKQRSTPTANRCGCSSCSSSTARSRR